MTPEDLEKLFALFERMTINQNKTYDHNLYEHMMRENKLLHKFMVWVKLSYPDVWEGWRALKDIEND
jgi:hypothetical protein